MSRYILSGKTEFQFTELLAGWNHWCGFFPGNLHSVLGCWDLWVPGFGLLHCHGMIWIIHTPYVFIDIEGSKNGIIFCCFCFALSGWKHFLGTILHLSSKLYYACVTLILCQQLLAFTLLQPLTKRHKTVWYSDFVISHILRRTFCSWQLVALR